MNSEVETPVPEGYKPVFHQGFNAWMGPIWARMDGPLLGPHHYILDVQPHHLNGGNMVHGGALLGLCDVVLGSTVANAVGGMGATISLNCDFLAGVKPGTRIEAEATISRLTKSVAFVSGRLFSGETTFLTASGIWKVGDPVPGFSVTGLSDEPYFENTRPVQRVEEPGGNIWWTPARDLPAPEGFEAMKLGDPFEAHLGPYFADQVWSENQLEERLGFEVAFEIDDRHTNARGVCHGGAMMTFADATQGMVAWAAAGAHAVTLSLQSQFLKPGKTGDLVRTRPKLVRKTPSILFIESTFEIEDEIVFTASSLFKVIGR